MNKKYLRTTALSLACALTAVSFCSCAENSEYSSSYNAAHYSSSQYENADSEAEESADEWYYEESSSASAPSPNEEYQEFIESGFKDPNTEPLSTFSADVDTASYSNVRRLIEDAQYVPEDAVRIEEFINYFDYDYPDPQNGDVFGKYVEIADCPWNSRTKLMMVGIQGMRIEQEETPPSNLVFLIDSSGSMSSYDKLPLVQTAFSMLAENLTENDRISIVTYANSSSTIIAGADGTYKDDILEALYSINAGGGTNGEGGIETAYELAEEYFIEGGNNRIIIATDGDLNIGASTGDELVELIETKRDKGIYLSVLGFGTGNIKDNRLEALADNGNGNYSYIDSVDEAQRVLVTEMSGTLYTVAKDVKIQVEFNPSQISSYRLIGYDNRLMDAHDFIDNTKDAGEVGSGHSVTALYEIELADTSAMYDGIELEFASEHKTDSAAQQETNGGRTELCKLSVAYKDVDTNKDVYLSDLFGMEKYSDSPSDAFRLAGAVAEFGMLLRNSEYKENSRYEHVAEVVGELAPNGSKEVKELYDLVTTASSLYE